MQYEIRFKPQAIKDGKKIGRTELLKIFEKIEGLKNNLHGNIKKLTNFTPEYRLRVGNFRVLFEISGKTIFVYRIKHRRDAYK